MNVWIPNWFGIQTALIPFPDRLDFERCLKSELENPEQNAVYGYKSIQTGRVWFKWPRRSLKSEFLSVRSLVYFGFSLFGIQTFTVWILQKGLLNTNIFPKNFKHSKLQNMKFSYLSLLWKLGCVCAQNTICDFIFWCFECLKFLGKCK